MARHTRATPGVYARDRSSRVRRATFGCTSILPPRCSRKVWSETFRTSTPSIASSAPTTWSACGGVGGVAGQVGDDAVVVGVDHVERGDDTDGGGETADRRG